MGRTKAAVLAAAMELCASCQEGKLQESAAPAEVKGVDLGTFPLGFTAQGAVQVTSLGAAGIELSALALPAAPPAGFVLEGAAPLQVPSGATVSVPVSFTPAAGGNFDVPVTLTLTPGGAQMAYVTATAVAVNLGATPQALDFGDVSLHATATLQLTIANPSILAVSAGVSAAAPFQVAGGTTTTVPVPAGGSAEVAVAFTPTALGPSVGSVAVTACPGCSVIDVPASGSGVASVVSVSPASLAFGNLPVGQTATKTVTVANAGNLPLALTAVGVSTGAPPFSVSPGGSASVPGGGSLPLTVTFAPGTSGAFQGNLQIATADPGSPEINVPLTGSSGTGIIAVLPPTVDFGSVPTNTSLTQQILIENVGAAEPGVSPLTISSVSVSGVGFSIAAPPANTQLAAGQTVLVPVTFGAGGPGNSSGDVDIASDDPQTPLITVPLAGVSRTAAPCDWTASPPQVDFGLLEPGQSAVLGFALQNAGTDDCVISGLTTVGSAFSLTGGPFPPVLLPPGYVYDLLVQYAPTAAGVDTGSVQFAASSAPPGQVALLGSAAQGCLQISPTNIVFGDASSSCPPSLATVNLLDSCSEPVTIDQVSIGRGISPAFSVQPIPLPETLGPGGSTSLTVEYQPSVSEPDGTPDNAALLVDDGEGQPRMVGLTGTALQNPTQTDTFTQISPTPVDVLIVLDNSASFETQQAGVQQNVNAFVGSALDAGVDFHLGVTTTGIEPATGSWTTCPGGANGGEAGRLFPVDNSSPRIMTPQTPNLYSVFAYDTNVGVCHWDEQPFNAAVYALTPPLSTSAKDPGTPWPDDGNLGFQRANALLEILFIQDDDDESVVPSGYTVQTWVDHYVQILKELKGLGNEWMVTASAVTAVPGCNNPQDLGVRYFQLVSEMGGQIWSVCTTDWGQTMGQLGQQAFSLRLRFALSQPPASPSQITVTVNGQTVPTQDPGSGTTEWSYNTATGEVIFSPSYAPPPGAQITVTYPVACP